MKKVLQVLVSVLATTQTLAEKIDSTNNTESKIVGSHLDDIEGIEAFSWDQVKFLTRKDCALDPYPDVSD